MSIGGYFGLELNEGTQQYHHTPYALKSGRAALHYILKTIRPSCVLIPYYTCDALLEPFTFTGTPYRFYAINEDLEPDAGLVVGPGEYIIYINFFGLKSACANELSDRYGERLIIDATQAFFMKGDGRSWLFNSCRKFFGVADGGYLYPPSGTNLPQIAETNEDYEVEHLIKRFNGHVRAGYPYFARNEELTDCRLQRMSLLSERLLSHVDYRTVAERRRTNFAFLHSRLRHMNILNVHLSDNDVPMCYPLLLPSYVDKAILQHNDIFIPAFWQEVEKRAEGFYFEKTLAANLWPLPADHRYTQQDMEILSDLVIKSIDRA